MTSQAYGRLALVASMVCAMLVAGAPHAAAAGLLIADGGFGGVLEIEEHDVKVTINNGIAVTRVTQVFRNTESREVEALYTFPVPRGASVSNFSMWINGKEMIGEVLEKKRARQIYESYKRRRRDPGLLEQKDYKTFEMRVYPIPAKAAQKVQIAYYQELDQDHDWITWVYPLATATRRDVNSRAAGRFALSVQVKSEVPIIRMESPSHGKNFAMVRHSDAYHQASLETRGGNLERDVVLAYQVSRPRTGLDLIASKAAGEDGHFCLTLTSGEDVGNRTDGMDYVFVLDISGSMASDGKLIVSKDSLGAFIDMLGERDRFELITFNVRPNTLFNNLRPANAKSKARATAFLGNQQARGGTVLKPALTTAYRYADSDRSLNVVILSDGMTEQGERAVLLQLIRRKPGRSRVFCIGVGNEVNRPLLKQIAEDAGGLAAFLSRGDDFKRQAKAFHRKLLSPVATELRLEFAGQQVYDIVPKTLPNLYHGAPVKVYGRYRSAGPARVTLHGNVNGLRIAKTLSITLPDRDDDSPEVDRMWAWHRVQELQKQADRAGSRAAVVDDIVRLGEAYSIVTEYTSFLVLENDAEYRRWKIERRNALRITRDRAKQEKLAAKLADIRDKAVADIGPGAVAKQVAMRTATPVQPPAAPRNLAAARPTTQAQPQRPYSKGWDVNIGGGALDPVSAGIACGLGALAFAARRKKGGRHGR